MENNKTNHKNNSSKNNKNKPSDKFDWKRASKTSFVWLAIIFGAVYISGLLTEVGKKEVEIEFLWQKLIAELYSSKIDLDKDQIEKEILEFSKNKEKISEFKLAELEINYEKIIYMKLYLLTNPK